MTRFVTKEKTDYLYDNLRKIGLDILYITDSEIHRNVNLKYLTGHPEDATLIIDVQDREMVLIPWDYQLAQKFAEVDQIINIEDYGGVVPASAEILNKMVDSNGKIGVTEYIPYSSIQAIKGTAPNAEIIWNPKEIDSLLEKIRSTKSSYEISLFKKSVKISNLIVNEIEETIIFTKEIKTEMDLAIFVEKRIRQLGALGIGFETLVASSARSWQIHTYPRADPELNFYREGLALIDFGVNGAGLTSDVTLPFIMGKMDKKMKNIVETVTRAHDEAIEKLKSAHFLHEVANVAFGIIESAGFTMPHALGHGIGLTVHDSPSLRKKPTHEALLKSWTKIQIEEGMVFTIEPGIYEQDVGGFRLENNVIITSKGPEVVTNSRALFIER